MTSGSTNPGDTYSYWEYYYNTSYQDLEYSWTFSDGGTATSSSGTRTFSGLVQGAMNLLTATVTVTCTQIQTGYYYYSYTTYDENGNPSQPVSDSGNLSGYPAYNYNYYVGSATVSIYVYTRPGIFTGYEFEKDTRIHDFLTAQVTEEWCEHCGKFLSWKNQTNKYGSINYSGTKDAKITAEWFNNQRIATGKASAIPAAEKDKTRIQAEMFKLLGLAISADNAGEKL